MAISIRPLILLSFFFLSIVLQSQNNQELFFVFLNTNPDKPEISEKEIQDLQAAHLENIGKLAEEGIIKAAGPFECGGGLFIMQTESLDKAKSILQSDEAIKANRFKLEIFPFQLIINNVCGAKEPYEMVTYQFVRLIPENEYFGKIDLTKHENKKYFSKLNNDNESLLVYGSFGDDGGMIIFDFPQPHQVADILTEHPLVKAGQLKFEIRPLWIAKGTFCKR